MSTDYVWNRGHGPVPRLYEDVERIYHEGLRRSWEAVAPPMAREHIIKIEDGWVYNRGPEYDEESSARLKRHQEQVATYTARSESWYEQKLRPQVIEIIERLRKHPRPTRPLRDLVDHLEACMEGQGHVMGDLHWRMAAGMIATAGGPPKFEWPPIYAEITGRPENEAVTFVAGLGNELTKTIRRLRRLARLAASDPELCRVVTSGDLAAIESDPRFRTFRSGFRSLLRRYGHRTGSGWGSSIEFGAPTWNVRPALPLQMIATYARSKLGEMDERDRQTARARKRLLREVRRSLRDDPERLARFEFELARAMRTAFLLEDHNDWMDQSAPGVVRDAAHVVGQRLARDRVIDDPEDVVHLSLAELRSPPANARALVEERKRQHEQRQKDTPDFEIPRVVMHDEGEGQVGNELRGVAASGGRYTGRARVFMPSPMLPDVDDGDILVAVDAGPDWTPLFAILGAVCLDKGAAWQHAAVMAREFGIPGVTGTKDGTSVIKDGETITVDGDAGVVELG